MTDGILPWCYRLPKWERIWERRPSEPSEYT